MRRKNWPVMLDWYLSQRVATPFAWGTNDCVLFAFGALQAMCSPAPTIDVPAWSDERSALERIRQYGGIDYVMGWAEEIRPAMAITGDVAMLMIDGRESLGVISAEHILGPGEHGIARHDRREAVRAWRVP